MGERFAVIVESRKKIVVIEERQEWKKGKVEEKVCGGEF